MKKYIKLIFVILLGLIIAGIGIGFGFFNYTKTSQNNKVIAGSLYLTMNQGTDLINLSNILPETKEEARSRNDNTLTFTIKGKNTSTTKDINYEIMLNNGTENANVQMQRIRAKDLVFDLIEIGPNNEETYVLDAVSYNALNNQRIWVDKVNKNTTSEIERTYKLRVWVSDDIIVSDTASNADYTTTEYKNLYASIKVVVEGDLEEKTLRQYKCIRATTLHTETCTQTSDYCAGDGYTGNNTTITYGNLGTTGTLVAGDAFDCDVNGDGIVNEDTNGNSTERFYYVSPYYNTNNQTFDNTYATLIYYSNTYNNGSSVVISTNGAAYYASANENWHGPVTAITHLPTTQEWSNIQLKTTSRTILACDNGDCSNTPVLTTNKGSNQIENPFNYTGRAARLLTLPELVNGCKGTINNNTSLSSTGGLTSCNFLFEGTKYADLSKATYGPWLETPHASNSNSVWNAHARYRRVDFSIATNTIRGARPAIDVPMSLIKY